MYIKFARNGTSYSIRDYAFADNRSCCQMIEAYSGDKYRSIYRLWCVLRKKKLVPFDDNLYRYVQIWCTPSTVSTALRDVAGVRRSRGGGGGGLLLLIKYTLQNFAKKKLLKNFLWTYFLLRTAVSFFSSFWRINLISFFLATHSRGWYSSKSDFLLC